MKHCYVDLPSNYEKVFLYDDSGKRIRQVLWGDWLRIDDTDDGVSELCTILWAWNDPDKKQKLKIRRKHLVRKRPLEIIFVDVGQGDGAVLITPERDENERIVVIDAGKGHHMQEFLDKRFKSYRVGFNFDAAVITHPDNDHYLGFQKIFKSANINFDKVYHSGLVERPTGSSWEKLGGLTFDPNIGSRGTNFLEDLVVGDEKMRELFGAPVDVGEKDFSNTIRAALDNDAVEEFCMLSTMHGTQEAGKSC